MVDKSMKSKQFNIQLLEGLISIGQREQAFRLIENNDIDSLKSDKQIMSIYINLMSDKNLEKATKIMKQMLVPSPSDLFDSKLVEKEGYTEEDCVQKLIDAGMPEKTKENKTMNVAQEMMGGAAVFIPKKRTHKTRYPKSYDPANPGQLPDPERWLPKWQRSRFKKMAKKKGIYLKGA